MLKRIIQLFLLMVTSVCSGQTFPEKWPQINNWMQMSVTNLQSGGVVTNEPVLGYIQKQSNNTYKIYFPVGGIVTQVVEYIPPARYLNVSGGLLTMSGSPTGGVNVIELIPATLISDGFVKSEGTPSLYWDVGLGLTPIRLRKDANGFSIRNSSDTEYRDLFCRNLFVYGTNNIVSNNIVNIETNRITLNSNYTNGAPFSDAYLAVSRGSSPTAMVQWVESLDQWLFGYDGNMQSIGSIATGEVANVWPQIKTFDASAQTAVSNLWPWVVAITPAQIYNWDTIHVWSTNETYDTVTNYWPNIFDIDNMATKTNWGNSVVDGSVDMNSNGFQRVNLINFTNDEARIDIAKEGDLWYDYGTGTLNFRGRYLDTTLQFGFESLTEVINKTGTTLTNGEAVYMSGGIGGVGTDMSVARAYVDGDAPERCVGLVTTTQIVDNATGLITQRGIVNGLDTSAWTNGTSLYLSTEAGKLTNVWSEVFIGIVKRQNANTGQIWVNPSHSPFHADDTITNSPMVHANVGSFSNVLADGYAIEAAFNGLSISDPVLTFGLDTNGVFANVKIDGTTPIKYWFKGHIVDYGTNWNVRLTAGTTNTPTLNYICALADGTITNYTTYPLYPESTNSRAIMFEAFLMDTNSVANGTGYALRSWTENYADRRGVSRISAIGERVRRFPAQWEDGVQVSLNGTNQTLTATNDAWIATTSGTGWQMHSHTIPSNTNRQDMWVLNDSAGFLDITNLNQIVTDATGNAVLVNRPAGQPAFGIEVLAFVESGITPKKCRIMLLLSTDDYNTGLAADNLRNCIADSSGYAQTGVPVWMQGMTIRLAKIVVQRANAGGDRDYYIYNRRGQPLGTAGGGSSSSGESDPIATPIAQQATNWVVAVSNEVDALQLQLPAVSNVAQSGLNTAVIASNWVTAVSNEVDILQTNSVLRGDTNGWVVSSHAGFLTAASNVVTHEELNQVSNIVIAVSNEVDVLQGRTNVWDGSLTNLFLYGTTNNTFAKTNNIGYLGLNTNVGSGSTDTNSFSGNMGTNSLRFTVTVTNASTTLSGGTITDVGTYRIHSFTNVGTYSFTNTISNLSVRTLVVAGGGSGGFGVYVGAGGGAGGMIDTNFTLSTGVYSVVVGAGGTSASSSIYGEDGSNSVFGSYIAYGGGAGGVYPSYANGRNGGSGGGASTPDAVNMGTGGAGTNGQGYAGGSGTYGAPAYGAAGGGGAGGTGSNASPAKAGDGGIGRQSDILVASTNYYAGGGGGGAYVGPIGAGGLGGGGSGSTGAGTNGTANTGGGGGGAERGGTQRGGNGGSGIVILRYAISDGTISGATSNVTVNAVTATNTPTPVVQGVLTYGNPNSTVNIVGTNVYINGALYSTNPSSSTGFNYFYATNTADQSVSDGVLTKFTSTNVAFDTLGWYNSTGSLFRVQANSTWQIITRLYHIGSGIPTYENTHQINVNGTLREILTGGSCVLSLNSNDYVEIYTLVGGGGGPWYFKAKSGWGGIRLQ